MAMNKIVMKAIALSLISLSVLIPSLHAAKSNTIFKDQVAVIMYHHVDDEATSSGTIPTRLFQNQLTHLKNKGYQFITLRQFKEFMQGASVPNNAVLVTFDDGYESFYTNAYPILKKMRIPAVNFIITGDLENPTGTYIPSLSREHIIEMTSDTNFIDAQCHTDSMHGRFPEGTGIPEGSALLLGRNLYKGGQIETDEQYKERIINDTQACVSKLSELYAEPIDAYAYPFGIYDKTVSSYIQQAGIQFAFTIVPEMATRDLDPMQIPRINAGHAAISPEGLETSIRRRVVATGHPFNEVPLAETLGQLGGKAITASDNSIVIQFQNNQWTGAVNSQKLTAVNGSKTVNLQKPLYLKNNKAYIGFNDLENVIGMQIVYNPTIQSFSVRQSPMVKK